MIFHIDADAKGNKIQNLANGESPADAINKSQLDAAIAGVGASTSAANGYLIFGTGSSYTSSANLTFLSNVLGLNGTLRTANGTAAAPSFSFLNKTNTGIYTDTTNLMFSVNGANRMTITPQGRLINLGNTYSSIYLNAGNETATGFYNLIAGQLAGNGLTSGGTNIFLGGQSGENTTTGSSCAFIGYSAGRFNVNGSNNAAIAPNALYYNKAGINNVGIGASSLYYLDGGSQNVGIARDAGSSNVIGSNNISIGYQANGSQVAGTEYPIISTDTTDITITANLSAYVDKYVQFKTASTKPSLLSANTWYTLLVVSSDGTNTILRHTANVGTAAGTLFIREYTNLTNATAIGYLLQNNKSNQVALGGSAVTEFTLKNHIYSFSLSAASLGSADNGKFWAFNNATGKIELSDLLKVGNGSSTAPSMSFRNAATTGLYLDGSKIGASILGVKRFDFESNAGTFLNLFTVAGELYGGLKINVNANEQYIIQAYSPNGLWFDAPTGRHFKWRVNAVDKLTVSASEINTHGTKITGLPTSGATASDAISVEQADANYAKKTGSAQSVFNTTIAANTQISQDVTITGVAATDFFAHNFDSFPPTCLIRVAYQATNTVRIYVYNSSSSSITLNGSTVGVVAFK